MLAKYATHSLAGRRLKIEFEQVIRDYGPLFSRVAASYEANESLRQELYQEICMAVWQSIQNFRGDANIKTYLLKVAHNRCVTHISKEVNRIKAEEYAEAIDQDSKSNIESKVKSDLRPKSPEQELMMSSQLNQLLSAVRKLKLPAKQVMTLSLEGLSYQEISDVTGLKVSNIGVIITRTKKDLQGQMQA